MTVAEFATAAFTLCNAVRGRRFRRESRASSTVALVLVTDRRPLARGEDDQGEERLRPEAAGPVPDIARDADGVAGLEPMEGLAEGGLSARSRSDRGQPVVEDETGQHRVAVNPSGVQTRRTTVEKLLALMEKRSPRALRFIDETYRDASYGDAPSGSAGLLMKSRDLSQSSFSSLDLSAQRERLHPHFPEWHRENCFE